MQHTLIFNTTWPWWVFALALVGGVAAVIWLYRYEQTQAGGVKGVLIGVCRVLLVILAVLMLAQPVLRTRHDIAQRRQVAVLIDDSLSMSVRDPQAPPALRMRWADAVGLLPHDARPIRPELLAQQLAIVANLSPRTADQATQAGLFRGRQTPLPLAIRDDLAGRADTLAPMLERLAELARPLTEQRDLAALLPPVQRTQWDRIAARLNEAVTPSAETLTERLDDLDLDDSPPEDFAAVAEAANDLARAAAEAADLLTTAPEGQGESLAWAVDRTVAGRLGAADMAALDKVATLGREALARRLLATRGGDLLTRIRGQSGDGDADNSFVVQVYRFAGSADKLDPAALEADDGPTTRPSDRTLAQRMATDPAAALDRVFASADATGMPVAGVVLLTDGNFNGPRDPALMSADRRVPILPIRIGADVPPPDLAVLKLETPQSLFKEDTATVSALLKLDGLAGRDVEVQLVQLQAGNPSKIVRSETVRPAAASERRYVQFDFKPDAAGVSSYRVVATPAGDREAFEDSLSRNDRQDFSISVTEERTKVLIVDGPPRWEFQYVKNLLLRDKGTLVQHVLSKPAVIEGQKQRGDAAVRHASVKLAREKGISEVDRLPRTVEELFAFDVIILGDVAIDLLDDGLQAQLERFVAERGGTLIVVAGKRDMPNAYADRPLTGVLPATIELPESAPPPTRVPPFRLRLTDEGQSSDILRLADTPEENQRLWQRIPPSTWRQSTLAAKAGATVLAYAVDVRGLSDDKDEPEPDIDASDLSPAERERRVARTRPLILHQNYGLGHVMLLGYDRTWQLRYKVGDKYHHRFWGQVMRWATAGRLPAGSDHVKLGTDRARYRPGSRISVRARLTKEDFTPAATATMTAEIRRGTTAEPGQLVTRVNLLPADAARGDGATTRPSGGSGTGESTDGLFVAQLPPLDGGAYTVSLMVESAVGVPEESLNQPVTTEFVVEGDDPTETHELAARSPTELAADGVVLEPSTAALIDQLLGPPVLHSSRYEQTLLWSSWWWLLLFVAIAALEWWLRKRAGLI